MAEAAFDVAAFHRDAVSTPSHESVDAMRSLLVDTLESHGHTSRVDDAGVVYVTRGEGDPHLVLNTHIDTVPPHVAYAERASVPGVDAATEPVQSEGEAGAVVGGRGACDAKGPLAAMVGAFCDADLPDGRVTLAVTPDEETTQTGAASAAEALSADAYVVGEPTDLDVCIGARGQFEGRVTITGESAHAANPEEGTNAIRALAPVLQALESYDDAQGPGSHDVLGRPGLTATMVEGGEATNQIPGECVLTFDRRSVPPEQSAEFPTALEAHLSSWLPAALSCSVALLRPDTPFPEAFATDPETPIVSHLRAAGAGEPRAFGAATEASQFAADAPTVVFGPGVLADAHGAVAHSEREYVRRADLGRARDVLRDAAESFLRAT